ncbi:MAG: phosphatase PAP2 family protein [Leptospiraceae bacterium]|nr:phosphatase PAP2 family protein [Leptospiraceae bacterium]
MEPRVPFENEILFGNKFLESIPHPTGFLGDLINLIVIICHYLGAIGFFFALIPFTFYFYNRRFGVKLAVAVISTGIFNGLAKFFFKSPRPTNLSSQFDRIQTIIKEGSFGLPSGHSHVSILLWGMIFLHFKNIYIRILAAFFIITTPFTRLFAGVHYPGDVIFGFCMGLVSLIIIELFFKAFPDFPDVNSWKSPGRSFRSASLFVLALSFSTILLGNTKLIEQEIQSLNQIVSASGSVFGLFLGLGVLKHFHKEIYSTYLNQEKLKTILILGAGILVFQIGLGKLGEKILPNDFLFRYVRYAILNFYIVMMVPYLVSKFSRKQIQ